MIIIGPWSVAQKVIDTVSQPIFNNSIFANVNYSPQPNPSTAHLTLPRVAGGFEAINSLQSDMLGLQGRNKSSHSMSDLASNTRNGDTHEDDSAPATPTDLDPHHNARAVIRLVQCRECSRPLKSPMTLPCGNSLCRSCLPDSYPRTNISYPGIESRQVGFRCPFPDCGIEHSMADCSLDVTLNKVMDVITNTIARFHPAPDSTSLVQVQELRPQGSTLRPQGSTQSPSTNGRQRAIPGGRLVATYALAEMGELEYEADAAYQTFSPLGDEYEALDIAVMEHLKEAARVELDCQVCYSLMLDPLTTSCGHTYCRKCLHRILDHSSICPICRRVLEIPQSLLMEASNKRLTSLLAGLCPDAVAQRAEMVALEETGADDRLNTPLFVCTLAFPTMPTFLHVFEPRYRLMIRRAIESGNRKFGMMMYNRYGESQGGLGTTQFMEYGTLLHIINVEMLADGRSLIETVGVSRFKVNEWGFRDGYIVADLERFDDISMADEERLEAAETSRAPVPNHDLIGQLDRMSTEALLQIGLSFVTRMRACSAPWLHERVLAAYGTPPEDAASFPYWFASILPISDEEKYKLLKTTNVRGRLKICAKWVKRIEAQRWYAVSLAASIPDDAEE